MANFDYLRVPGTWVPGSVLSHGEMAAIDAMRPKLINAEDGSTHAPGVQIVIAGEGIYISGPSRLDEVTQSTFTGPAEFEASDNGIASGGILKVRNGGTISVLLGGTINIGENATLDFDDGANLTGGTIASTATIDQTGPFTFASGTWPKLDARVWERHTLDIAVTTYNTGAGTGPDTADTWTLISDIASSPRMLRTRTEIATGGLAYIKFFELPGGGTMTNVVVTSLGVSGTNPILPIYEIFRWKEGEAAESMSVATPDVHTAANWASSILDTTLTVNAFATIDKSYTYGIRITHPYQTGVGAAVKIYDIVANGIATDIRL